MQKKNSKFEVLLIDPGIQLKTQSNVKYINRGLLSIATYLKSKGVDITYFPLDHYFMNEKMNEDQVFAEIKKVIQKKNINLSAISNLFIAETDNTIKIARFIKDSFPEIKTVIGGYNPTINDQEIIENKEIDYIIKGEGEWALYELISALRNGGSTHGIAGLISKKHIGPERERRDLSELPPIDYSILPKEYLLNKNAPRVNLEINRGCYHNCSFCSVSQFWQEKLRSHNPNKLITEFKQLKKLKYQGVISLEETMVNFKSEAIKEFLKKLTAFKDDFEFDFITTRYDFIDEESLSLIDEIGFKNLMMGLESASKKIQDKINKHLDLERFIEACEIIKKYKVKLNVYMIVGLPGETRETNAETHLFLSHLLQEGLINSVFPCNFQPYRGTLAREQLKEVGGKILAEEKDYFKWLMRDEPLVEYENLKADELKMMLKKMLDLNKNVKNPVIEKLR